MADLNVIYSPAVDYVNPDVVIFQRPGGLFGLNPIDVYLPDEIRDQIRKMNADAVSTAEAVKVEYKGSTPTERTAWLKERIAAVDKRLQFVKDRTFQLLDQLQGSDQAAYNALLKSFTAAISAVPVIGGLVSAFVGQDQAVQQLNAFKLQTLIKDYQTDAEQLVKIRQALGTEYAAVSTTDPPKDNAPKPIPTWVYYAGAVVLLIGLYIWQRRRKTRKRSKR